MIRGLALRRAGCYNVGVRTSYAEISRFFRTRHHGITPSRAGVRCLTSEPSVDQQRAIPTETSSYPRVIPQEASKSALADFKASVRSGFGPITSALNKDLENKIGSTVSIAGYLGSRRNQSKTLTFALLRNPDQTYCIQVVSFSHKSDTSNPEKTEAHRKIRNLKEWTPVVITGTVKSRSQPSKDDTAMGMPLANTIELDMQSIEVLNGVSNDLLSAEDTVYPPQRRHLQLRTDAESRGNLLFRAKVTKQARRIMEDMEFTEVETPILFKSTPEGAREFLVPTRRKGLAYALPQSPQQYKQILMASGITKYFQFARCFRDEDMRADRQPEFTQLDMEMSFVGEEDVMLRIETLLTELWDRCLNLKIDAPFQRITYHEAMASYGSDKPDLRLGMQIHDITGKVSEDFVKMISDIDSPVVEAFTFPVSDEPKETAKFIEEFMASREAKPFFRNPAGQPGVLVQDGRLPMGGLSALGYDFVMNMPEGLAPEQGDLMILQARKNEPFSGGSTPIGDLRLALHKAAVAKGLVPKPEGFRFLWITDFPLFTPSNDTDPGQGGQAGLSSTHHPFTAPKTPEDVDLLVTAPEKVIAAHYDIVVNGVELGGGSRRIHNAGVQEFIFRDVLKMPEERIEDFAHLLRVLDSGCPPHAGIALGWDRLIAMMLGKDSVRDVIAFPKTGNFEDLLVKSPREMTNSQLQTYHLRIDKN
ncbi:hypothetical protein M011DRAFT_463541 [Sporormia fimetaria CBS 119925]|uniref:Aminoacyl-transfer RNA synthetases class-II family profile domain-containing protein n=1 Tax=Sporormia fimetaria CBS 119925 TaxID=1340428 RepID=A0A6A6VS48_9PLEO|nr:hypothetical protein M011DRAFT_463541 [Sporormia fimetaria CBS 119925]